MLHDLVSTNREAIIARTTETAARRASPAGTELAEHGVPRFLSQLSQTLLIEGRGRSTPRLRGRRDPRATMTEVVALRSLPSARWYVCGRCGMRYSAPQRPVTDRMTSR